MGGGLRVVPFLLTGSDVATTNAVAEALEDTLLAFGTDAQGDVPLPFQADASLVGGGLRVVPFLLTGSDVATTNAVAEALEDTL
ncbi:hypothetical protein C7E17_25390, partial [Stenotrophomonas maltophilia]